MENRVLVRIKRPYEAEDGKYPVGEDFWFEPSRAEKLKTQGILDIIPEKVVKEKPEIQEPETEKAQDDEPKTTLKTKKK